MANIFEVRFEQVTQQATPGRFSIPQNVVDILGINSESQIIIETTSHKGAKSIITTLKSGNEIYGGLESFFESGELICVRVTKIGA